MFNRRWGYGLLVLMAGIGWTVLAQAPGGGKDNKSPVNSDTQLVERLLAARREYQEALETLRTYYIKAQKIEQARWAEDELLQYHRIAKQAYRRDMDLPPPNLQALYNIPEANDLMRRALGYKDKGWGTDYIDNQRRAELLLQQMLTKHPQSDKISEAAYLLGDLYESRAYRQYERAAGYFERCYQWNSKTHRDARLRAARLYEKLGERSKALSIYNEIATHETDQARVDEANKKLNQLKGTK